MTAAALGDPVPAFDEAWFAARAQPGVRGLRAYDPGHDLVALRRGVAATAGAAPLLELGSNENAYGPSPAARAAVMAQLNMLHRYPDPLGTDLKRALAMRHGVDANRIGLGNGSHELLMQLAQVFTGPGNDVVLPRYGFAVFALAARAAGATLRVVDALPRGALMPLGHDLDAIAAAITPATRLVYLANPNNPTGTMTSREEIARLHAGLRPDILFVLDQAYAEYLDAGEDDGGMELAKSATNILVTRTFSKIYGLAAERIGWGYASPAVIDILHRIRAPFNVTTAGQAAAVAAINDSAWVESSRTHNARWREWLAGEVGALSNHGLRVVPSKTNFLLILFDGKLTAEAAMKGLWDEGYATRWLPGQGLPNGLRITIGTKAQTRAVAAKLRAMAEAA